MQNYNYAKLYKYANFTLKGFIRIGRRKFKLKFIYFSY